ncbi:MAG TPA: lysoplasmalogenase [Erythrobacter sp.]|nr:lysoplasmalogenase [Erythrobacter sp.]
MPKRALVEHRPWLLAAAAAAIAFYFLRDNPIGGVWLILLKGSGVAFLAVYALRRSPLPDARILALVMALSALGDMGIELTLELGGALFFASHIAAMSLYLRNPRQEPSRSQKALAVSLLFAAPLVSWLVSDSWQIALYSLALGGMAATAWMSRFPRYRVGIGAVMFVVSDWLIFAGQGSMAGSAFPNLMIWPLYFSGQFLIATGVVQTLRGEHPASGS